MRACRAGPSWVKSFGERDDATPVPRPEAVRWTGVAHREVRHGAAVRGCRAGAGAVTRLRGGGPTVQGDGRRCGEPPTVADWPGPTTAGPGLAGHARGEPGRTGGGPDRAATGLSRTRPDPAATRPSRAEPSLGPAEPGRAGARPRRAGRGEPNPAGPGGSRPSRAGPRPRAEPRPGPTRGRERTRDPRPPQARRHPRPEANPRPGADPRLGAGPKPRATPKPRSRRSEARIRPECARPAASGGHPRSAVVGDPAGQCGREICTRSTPPVAGSRWNRPPGCGRPVSGSSRSQVRSA